MSDDRDSVDADRLEITGILAPVIRSLPNRKVKVYDHKTGETKGECFLTEVAQAVGKLVLLEFGVEDGVRPQKVKCGHCGRVFATPTGVRAPKPLCVRCRRLPCAGCGRPSTAKSSMHARRLGCKSYCGECSPVHKKALSPCFICGGPSTTSSSEHARRQSGRKPYCELHRNGRREDPCARCGKLTANRKHGVPTCFPLCGRLPANQPNPKKLREACAVCGLPATERSSRAVRCKETKAAYCANHPRGKTEMRAAGADRAAYPFPSVTI